MSLACPELQFLFREIRTRRLRVASFFHVSVAIFRILGTRQAEFARRLFRLAQQEYHSRYECLSHGEIRFVCLACGACAL